MTRIESATKFFLKYVSDLTRVSRRDAVWPDRKFAFRRCRFDVTSADQPARQGLHDGHAPRSAITTSGCDVIAHRHREVAFRGDGYTAEPEPQQQQQQCTRLQYLIANVFPEKSVYKPQHVSAASENQRVPAEFSRCPIFR